MTAGRRRRIAPCCLSLRKCPPRPSTNLSCRTEPGLRCFTVMLNSRRISRISWVLSVANVLGGLALFVLARKVLLDLAALKPSLLLPTRLFLWVGPGGWLGFMLSSSALLLVSRTRFHQRWLNRGLTAASWIALSGAVTGVACFIEAAFFQPICTLGSSIAPQ
jgi:hypothetical protein